MRPRHDVVATLGANPAPSLEAPLASLLELLPASSVFMDQWSSIVLEKVVPLSIPAIHVRDRDELEDALSGRFADLGAFAAAWPTKITVLYGCIDAAEEVQTLTRNCKHLDDGRIHVNSFAALLPSLPPSICRVWFDDDRFKDDLNDEDNPPDDSDDEGNHVGIGCILARDAATALASVLVTAPSLTTLSIERSFELVEALPKVASFAIEQASTEDAKQFLAHLDLANPRVSRLKSCTTSAGLCPCCQ
ncbi:hypothetical protein SPRG_18140 [Saprolegnia parasitica CBS 223.65]|uniref:Uncharacterized protein n=1 Tax=Saprolegnia parasitica (strain CBS 223.65) TaxID=695850 RepID=A0A067BPS0_SAPPC|nr:hypothetical protein SPRG_18140 [Saprolegnia parasitica CBS 223.65]KDO16326.1 hypothetical protein SPRG_18140 [Saprolegnia parasitica CBS 223.65]|eukprot:XP_012212966.1 hypothetical protein SPRG_18140 [Saprolegnia parasitica CBS 223.65]